MQPHSTISPRRGTVNKICHYCEKEYSVGLYRFNTSGSKFCNGVCKKKHDNDLLHRLLENVEFDPITECWIWTGARSTRGNYGIISYNHKSYKVNRISLHVFYNLPLDTEFHALHSCDNPPCFSPDHVHPGNQDMNNKEAALRNRTRKGENSPVAILDDEKVRIIRKLHSERYSYRKIAAMINVSPGTVQAILQGRTWSHIT